MDGFINIPFFNFYLPVKMLFFNYNLNGIQPRSGWSHASQKVGGDIKTMRGRYNQVTILSFLNPLWRGKIYVKYNTSYMCHSMGCEILLEVKCYRLRKRFIQRLVTKRVVVGSAKLWGILITVGICLAKQIVRCSPCKTNLEYSGYFQNFS